MAADCARASLDHSEPYQDHEALDIRSARAPGRALPRRYKGRLIDFRVSIMPPCMAKTLCCACSIKKSMSEKFRS